MLSCSWSVVVSFVWCSVAGRVVRDGAGGGDVGMVSALRSEAFGVVGADVGSGVEGVSTSCELLLGV